jgi:RNA polymerase sigma-70 factor (ECF subfamily)
LTVLTDFSEAELVAGLQAGDETALQRIFDALAGGVALLLRRQFGGSLREEDIEDVLAISLDRLWRFRSRYDPQRSSLRTWFFLLARSAALDLLKQASRQAHRVAKSPSGECGDRPASNHPDSDIPAQVSDAKLRQAFLDVYHSLPAVDQRILLDYAQAAGQHGWATELEREFGIPAGTIRVRRRRLFERVRHEVAHELTQYIEQDSEQEECVMSTVQVIHELVTLFEPHAKELAELSDCILTWQREHGSRPQDAREVFARLWQQAARDGSLDDDRRRRILKQMESSLQQVDAARWTLREMSRELTDHCRRVVEEANSLRQQPERQAVVQIERSIVGISQIMQGQMPESVLNEGVGKLRINWHGGQAPEYAWKDSSESYLLLEIAAAAVEDFGAIPHHECPAVAMFLATELRAGSYELPGFVRLKDEPGAERMWLLWKRPILEESVAEGFLDRDKLPAGEPKLPSNEEQHLWEQHPALAQVLSDQLWQALQRPSHATTVEKPTADMEAEMREAVGRLIQSIGDVTGQNSHQSALLLLHVAYDQFLASRAGSRDIPLQDSAINFLLKQLELE